ncbi:MAG: alpha/beta hydrolase [Alphaproteobacteria bacterium]|nr:alpha/beta hydrolase [Alphaproteobacteria bacterium]
MPRLPRHASVERRVLRGLLALPPAAADRLFGAPPRNDRGTTMDAGIWRMVWAERRFSSFGARSEAARARADMAHSIRIVEAGPRPVPVAPLALPDAPPMRRYGGGNDGRGQAGIVWLHGGGWACGDLDTHDRFCRRLCEDTGRQVLSVDYRLAPEHPFPAGIDDSVAAWRAVVAAADPLGLDPARLLLGGDSAGGNLAAAACQILRDDPDPSLPRPAGQVLVYPATDLRRLTASHREFARGYLLDGTDIDWFLEQAVAPPLDPRASPALCPDLSGLPPAIVATAGFDPLRDEGEDYAAALAEAGVPVTHLDEGALVHGYLHMDGVLPAADAAVARLCAAVQALGG